MWEHSLSLATESEVHTQPSLLFLFLKTLQNEGGRLNQWFPSRAVRGNFEGLGLRCPF